MNLLSRLRRTEPEPPAPYSVDNPPAIRDDARTYVAHGDNTWGNSITYRDRGENELSVSGWLASAPFPKVGDKLLVGMESGEWGVYVFGEAGRMWGVSDGFRGTAFGPLDYAAERPRTTRCDEFITDLSPWLRT